MPVQASGTPLLRFARADWGIHSHHTMRIRVGQVRGINDLCACERNQASIKTIGTGLTKRAGKSDLSVCMVIWSRPGEINDSALVALLIAPSLRSWPIRPPHPIWGSGDAGSRRPRAARLVFRARAQVGTEAMTKRGQNPLVLIWHRVGSEFPLYSRAGCSGMGACPLACEHPAPSVLVSARLFVAAGHPTPRISSSTRRQGTPDTDADEAGAARHRRHHPDVVICRQAASRGSVPVPCLLLPPPLRGRCRSASTPSLPQDSARPIVLKAGSLPRPLPPQHTPSLLLLNVGAGALLYPRCQGVCRAPCRGDRSDRVGKLRPVLRHQRGGLPVAGHIKRHERRGGGNRRHGAKRRPSPLLPPPPDSLPPVAIPEPQVTTLGVRERGGSVCGSLDPGDSCFAWMG